MRALAAVLSAALHLGLVLGMSALPDHTSVAAPTLVQVAVVRKPPPPVVEPPPEREPEPKPEPRESPRPPPTVKPVRVPRRTVERVVADEPPPVAKPEVRAEERPSEQPVTPPGGFSVDMSATVEGGSVAVPAVAGGGNMFADPADRSRTPGPKATAPARAESGQGQGNAPAGRYQVTRMPVLLSDEASLKPRYPPGAKERQIEGQVLLDVLVDASGRAAEVKVKRRLDPECDAEAVRLLKERVRFRPALAGEEAVPMWIELSVVFELER